MLTNEQQQAIVRAVTTALSKYATAEIAEERARNLATALLFPLSDKQRRLVVTNTLFVRRYDLRQFWDAVEDTYVAASLVPLPSNMTRLAWLVLHEFEPAEASKYLQNSGYTVPESVAQA